MKGMSPRRWRPERPASCGCVLGRYYESPKSKEDRDREKHLKAKREAREELERLFSSATKREE